MQEKSDNTEVKSPLDGSVTFGVTPDGGIVIYTDLHDVTPSSINNLGRLISAIHSGSLIYSHSQEILDTFQAVNLQEIAIKIISDINNNLNQSDKQPVVRPTEVFKHRDQ